MLQAVEVHGAVGAGDSEKERPGQGGGSAFGVDHVGLGLKQDLLAALDLGQDRQKVAHRAARHEQAGLLAEDRCSGLFQLSRGRVGIESVIAERRGAHARVHGLGRARDRVAAQVDGSRCSVVSSQIVSHRDPNSSPPCSDAATAFLRLRPRSLSTRRSNLR